MNNRYSDEIIMDLLPLYIEGMVSEDTAQMIRDYLGQNPECREAYEQMSADIPISRSSEAHPDKDRKKIKHGKIRPLVIIFVIYGLVMIGIWVLLAMDQLFFFR